MYQLRAGRRVKLHRRWAYEEGFLTVWTGGQPTVLGYYGTRQEASRTAAAYFSEVARLKRMQRSHGSPLSPLVIA
jgi:hypothetical protein